MRNPCHHQRRRRPSGQRRVLPLDRSRRAAFDAGPLRPREDGPLQPGAGAGAGRARQGRRRPRFFEVTNSDASQWCKADFLQPGSDRDVRPFLDGGGRAGQLRHGERPRGLPQVLHRAGQLRHGGNNTPIFFIRDTTKFRTSSTPRSAGPTTTCATTTCSGTSGRSRRSPPIRSPTSWRPGSRGRGGT